MEKTQRIRVLRQDLLACVTAAALLLLLSHPPDWRLISLGILGGLTTAHAARRLCRACPNRLDQLAFLGCFLLALLLQVTKFRIFPDYYFFDAASVQEIMITGDAGILGFSYLHTAQLCNLLKLLFPMDSQLLGGLFFFFCGIPACAWVLSNAGLPALAGWKKLVTVGFLFSYAALLPVFVWNTQKEAVQFFFLVLIAAVFQQAEKRRSAVALCYLLLMVVWGACFRRYYWLILAGSLLLLAALRMRDRKRRALCLAALCLLAVVGLLALKRIDPWLLTQLFESRAHVIKENMASRTVNTAIMDAVPNPDQFVPLYLLNYAINAVRMMVPMELLSKGPLQICFVGWQLLTTGLLSSAIVHCWRGSGPCSQNWRAAFVICWYLVSFLFEPDFGSFVRHQAALFPIAWPLLMRSPAENIPTKKSSQGS